MVALADDIAYNNHDVDDGVAAGLFTLDDLLDADRTDPGWGLQGLSGRRSGDHATGGCPADDRGDGRRRSG